MICLDQFEQVFLMRLLVGSGRLGGLMMGALDSGSNGSGSNPGRGHRVALSTQVYKWVLANLLLGVTLRWTSIPSRGEKKYS